MVSILCLVQSMSVTALLQRLANDKRLHRNDCKNFLQDCLQVSCLIENWFAAFKQEFVPALSVLHNDPSIASLNVYSKKKFESPGRWLVNIADDERLNGELHNRTWASNSGGGA